MSIPRALLIAASLLTITLTAPAAPPAAVKIEHLEIAAKHLAEAGMMEESTRLRVQAAAMRRDLNQGELAELQAMIEALRQENRALQQRLEQFEAETRPRTAQNEPAPDLDQLAAEAHRRQTEETWARVKQAARGPRPLPAAPADQALPLEAPQPLPPAVDVEPPRHAEKSDHALLEEILRTLQSIERNMGN